MLCWRFQALHKNRAAIYHFSFKKKTLVELGATTGECVGSLVDKKTWVKFTRENILRSSREREKSNKLHMEMDGYLRSAAVELYSAYNLVNHALSARVQETTDVKDRLQERLLRVRSHWYEYESGYPCIWVPVNTSLHVFQWWPFTLL